MDLTLKYAGILLLKNWRTTNKVTEDEEILTGYCAFEGLVPAEMFGTLTGMSDIEYRKFYWATDGQIRHPSMTGVPFNTVADAHVIDFKSGLAYREEDATVRKFKLSPAYGHQWVMTVEVLVRPKTPAVIGRFAAKEGHEVSLSIEGPRDPDLISGIDG